MTARASVDRLGPQPFPGRCDFRSALSHLRRDVPIVGAEFQWFGREGEILKIRDGREDCFCLMDLEVLLVYGEVEETDGRT